MDKLKHIKVDKWSKKKNVVAKNKREAIREAFASDLQVEVIPAINTENPLVHKKLRVAAYYRVSTFEEAQAGSFELQIQSYSEKIRKNSKWSLVDIYADQGVSGTSTNKRENFNRMLEDCRMGKIDLIIVKSISRFSRNLLDFTSINRELKALDKPVGIYIEDVNLNTLDSNSELLLGLMSLIAQSESEQKSASIRWALIEKFKKGIPIFPTHNLLGYTKSQFGKIEIVEEEAEIVRYIYDGYLAGNTVKEIAQALTDASIPTVMGKATWSSASIYSILKNEKYCGDILMQKTYTVDCFTHKTRKNTGQRPQYRVTDGMPAIISRGNWDAVQKQLKEPHKRRARADIKPVEKKVHIRRIKSGFFKDFMVINTKWTKEELQEVYKLEGIISEKETEKDGRNEF